MLYEFHMLKNYPPTNLNRDDTGAPKTCMFGNATRGRVSSQCLKRAWRRSDIFRAEIGEENLGIRTRQLPGLISEKLLEMGADKEKVDALEPKISGFGNKDGKENKKGNYTAQVVFYAPDDIEAVATIMKNFLDNCATKKDVDKLKGKELQDAIKGADVRPITVDIALFGRMVTSDAFRDVDAAMQVAHAISTNKILMESDYFTAMDDMLAGDSMDERGAAMIDDIDYNSSCYYIYASLDTDILRENLKYSPDADQIVRKTVPALLKAMAFTNPSGKQNSFAGHVLPSAVMVECKSKKIPTSLANAFVQPVGGKDLVKESIQSMMAETDMLARDFQIPVDERIWFCVDKYDIHPESATKCCKSFSELVDSAVESLK
ncbi:MAG: type I-E CRISPR-associated protein Cas7/Cse4/CasC [Lachnospiraceae bacterium]|nr:type I-E CRISPR-associated protein Cas7/Cse4/CasC [Lachnospiraceae bacterium]